MMKAVLSITGDLAASMHPHRYCHPTGNKGGTLYNAERSLHIASCSPSAVRFVLQHHHQHTLETWVKGMRIMTTLACVFVAVHDHLH